MDNHSQSIICRDKADMIATLYYTTVFSNWTWRRQRRDTNETISLDHSKSQSSSVVKAVVIHKRQPMNLDRKCGRTLPVLSTQSGLISHDLSLRVDYMVEAYGGGVVGWIRKMGIHPDMPKWTPCSNLDIKHRSTGSAMQELQAWYRAPRVKKLWTPSGRFVANPYNVYSSRGVGLSDDGNSMKHKNMPYDVALLEKGLCSSKCIICCCTSCRPPVT
jgi:hypothetical protein